jgi:hypothetical protein
MMRKKDEKEPRPEWGQVGTKGIEYIPDTSGMSADSIEVAAQTYEPVI